MPPTTSFLKLTPAGLQATSGTKPSSTWVVNHANTNNNEEIANDNLALLTELQSRPIHPPPGCRPHRTGGRALTRTQQEAERKSIKDAKQKIVEERLAAASRKSEDRKLASATCKALVQAQAAEKKTRKAG